MLGLALAAALAWALTPAVALAGEDADASAQAACAAALEGRWTEAREAALRTGPAPALDLAWSWRPWLDVDGATGACSRPPGLLAYRAPGEPAASAQALGVRDRLAAGEAPVETASPWALLDRLWRDRLWRETRGMAGLPEQGPLQDLAAGNPKVAFACSLQAYVLRPPAPEQHPDADYAAEQRRKREEAEGYREQAQAIGGAVAALMLVLGLWSGLRLRPKDGLPG
ncbi:MAG: hypothetical protein ACKOSS_10695 [Planctomycetia bacterium]